MDSIDSVKTTKDEKKKLITKKCKGYSSIKPKHPYITEEAMKDLDDIFWID